MQLTNETLRNLTQDANGKPLVGFASLDYTNEHGEHAIHTIIIGVNYSNTLEASRSALLTDMELCYGFTIVEPGAKDATGKFTLTAERIFITAPDAVSVYTQDAAKELLLSIYNSINSRLDGHDNTAYTKANTYTPLMHGVKIHNEEGTIELSGHAHAKRIITRGTYPTVNSRPKTIAKNALRRELPLGKWKTYRLDRATCAVRKGETLFFGSTMEIAAKLAEHVERHPLVTA